MIIFENRYQYAVFEKMCQFSRTKLAQLGGLLYNKIHGKFPGNSHISGNFPGSREDKNPGKMETLVVLTHLSINQLHNAFMPVHLAHSEALAMPA